MTAVDVEGATIEVTVNSNFVAEDFFTDSIASCSSDITDTAANVAICRSTLIVPADQTRPTLVRAYTLGNSAGFVDRIQLEFSEPLRVGESASCTVAGLGSRSFNSTGIIVLPANVLRTGSTPQVTYNSSTGNLIDPSGNKLESFDVVTEDRALPQALVALASGDQIRVNFSETMCK